VIAVESNHNPRAVSPKGALGLMQLMPATAARYAVADPFDVRENLRAGATHLRRLVDRYAGDITLALAAYNAGEAAVQRHGGIPPYPETQRYVPAVLARYAARATPPQDP
jgi:soluble lytic murein transglycosylase-like protein